MKNIYQFFVIIIFLSSCKKYLDKKPDQSFVIPSTIEDCQALLDQNTYVNSFQNNATGEISADNYYLRYDDWQALPRESNRSMYVWGEEIFFDDNVGSNDWSNLNSVVYRANVVLETLLKINVTPNNTLAYNNAKGTALFIRAEARSVLLRNFANAYQLPDSYNDPGIPLRSVSDFNASSIRSPVYECYQAILKDLAAAARELPDMPSHVMRPSRPAAFALLSRVYLTMNDYENAGLYADSCLKLKSTLLDFNNISGTVNVPFARFNDETIYFAQGSAMPVAASRGRIDSTLFKSYQANDLRKSRFFTLNSDGTHGFKGHMSGSSSSLFVGIATDEVYLNRAECLARQGDYIQAIEILNVLLKKRFDKNHIYVPVTATNAPDAVRTILMERRKELLCRDLRWIDIKRLNKAGESIRLERNLNGEKYGLEPNDPKFALPLPAKIIELSSMQQNPR